MYTPNMSIPWGGDNLQEKLSNRNGGGQMTYADYGKLVGKSGPTVCRAMNARRGEMKSCLANQLSAGGFLSAHDWKYSTPACRKRAWAKWINKIDDSLLIEAV